MDRLTFDGNFCDIAQCTEVRGGSFCESGSCSQRKVWERLKYFEDAEEQGQLAWLPCKVGDRVWCVAHGLCEKRNNDKCNAYCDGYDELCDSYDGKYNIGCAAFDLELISEFGKTVFLTLQEAEKALEDAK